MVSSSEPLLVDISGAEPTKKMHTDAYKKNPMLLPRLSKCGSSGSTAKSYVHALSRLLTSSLVQHVTCQSTATCFRAILCGVQ